MTDTIAADNHDSTSRKSGSPDWEGNVADTLLSESENSTLSWTKAKAKNLGAVVERDPSASPQDDIWR